MPKILNITPNHITFYIENKPSYEYPPSDFQIRVNTRKKDLGDKFNIKVIEKTFEEVPDHVIEVLIKIIEDYDMAIVSSVVARALVKHKDKLPINKFYFISNFVRNTEKKIIGADCISPIESTLLL